MFKSNFLSTYGANNSNAAGTQQTSDKVVGYVYETSNFKQFTDFPLNRDICEKMVKDIKKGIMEGADALLEQLLIIKMNDGTSLLVGDGHTRLQAARELQKEGYDVKLRYVVRTEEEILKEADSVGEFIQRLNNSRKAWPLGDMIRFYAEDGSDEERQKAYAQLVKLHNSGKYFVRQKSNWRYIACILFGGIFTASHLKKGLCRNACKENDFEYHYRKINEIAAAMGLDLKNNFVEAFIKAWFTLNRSAEYQMCIERGGYKEFLNNLHSVSGDVKNADTDYWYSLMSSALPREFSKAE